MAEPDLGGAVRLQKLLARAGVASRRSSEKLISSGRIAVNGAVVCELGTKVDPAHDEVLLDGVPVLLPDAKHTIMLNKPAGFLTTMSDPQGRPCVADLVPVADYPGLYPIGRLDFDTTGLLLFSTDGALGHALLHPSHHVSKTYRAQVKGVPCKGDLVRLQKGIMLEDGMTAPAKVRLVDGKGPGATIELTIHEGRKRQVKRMCEAIGHPVLKLHRLSFGPLGLGSLKQGQWRELSSEEVAALSAGSK